jgi:hypothetical protein
MTGCSDIDSVWDIAELIKTCMLTTVASGQLRSRPMHAVPDRDGAASLRAIADALNTRRAAGRGLLRRSAICWGG